jgi:hypothetical protein
MMTGASPLPYNVVFEISKHVKHSAGCMRMRQNAVPSDRGDGAACVVFDLDCNPRGFEVVVIANQLC